MRPQPWHPGLFAGVVFVLAVIPIAYTVFGDMGAFVVGGLVLGILGVREVTREADDVPTGQNCPECGARNDADEGTCVHCDAPL